MDGFGEAKEADKTDFKDQSRGPNEEGENNRFELLRLVLSDPWGLDPIEGCWSETEVILPYAPHGRERDFSAGLAGMKVLREASR